MAELCASHVGEACSSRRRGGCHGFGIESAMHACRSCQVRRFRQCPVLSANMLFGLEISILRLRESGNGHPAPEEAFGSAFGRWYLYQDLQNSLLKPFACPHRSPDTKLGLSSKRFRNTKALISDGIRGLSTAQRQNETQKTSINLILRRIATRAQVRATSNAAQ
ncbi:hypothetical protein BDV96DRAFT_567483 [Lophiotrema nucula]|uniref:Uncharacterized protein n=1 Tax=Lophiotrema nucula TaxID=690887 RepID=A0A6A5ZMC0_9PLEO|nr:hypothetical protein BDV96DRAFT_567483 [Lophiotrema nucula]